ncbi:MAG: hypothetical protein N2589_04220 [bacterium]|nr:hypothetical protein [bacterium]
MSGKIGFFVIRSKFEVGAERGEALLKIAGYRLSEKVNVVILDRVIDNRETLKKGIEFFKDKEIDLFCVLLATWSDDTLILDLLSEIKLPVIIWAIPGIHYGSLCGGQQICSVLKEIDIPYKFVFGDIEDEDVYKEIISYSKIIALKNRLSKSKFGLIGHRIKGMTEIAYDEIGIKRIFGPRMIFLDIDSLKLMKEKVRKKEILDIIQFLKKSVEKIEVQEKALIDSIKFYIALKRWVKEEDIDGITVECYPELMGDICLAFSLLSEEGIVSSCEGDVNSLIATFILYKFTGNPVNNTDLLDINFNENWAIFSHCGSSSFSLAEEKGKIILSSVRLANKGVCCQFPSKEGDVTLINLVGGRDNFRSFIIQGKAIKTDMVFPGNPVKIMLPLKIEEFLKIIEEYGFGHHWMIGYGHVGDEIEELFKNIKVKYVRKG